MRKMSQAKAIEKQLNTYYFKIQELKKKLDRTNFPVFPVMDCHLCGKENSPYFLIVPVENSLQRNCKKCPLAPTNTEYECVGHSTYIGEERRESANLKELKARLMYLEKQFTEAGYEITEIELN